TSRGGSLSRRTARIRRAGPRTRRDRGKHPGRDLGQTGVGDLPRRERRRFRRHRGGGAAGRAVTAWLDDLRPAQVGTAVPRVLQPLHDPDATSPAPGRASGWGAGGTAVLSEALP